MSRRLLFALLIIAVVLIGIVALFYLFTASKKQGPVKVEAPVSLPRTIQ